MADELAAILETREAERLATGFVFTEGPLWHPDGFYYFVDVRSSVLYRLTPGRAHEVVRDKTGGGNGTTFDLQGRLVLCEGENRRVTRTAGDGHIEVRWWPSGAGASLPKLLVVQHRNDLWMNFGSANFTRRNLGDLNLESSVELRMPARVAPARAVTEYFNKIWSNAAADADLADQRPAAYWRYRFAEATGLSSF